MPDRRMFWRIVRRLFAAQRGRLLVILLALGAGAALTAALLNIQVDARSRLTKEFRAFGTNVIVAPRDAGVSSMPTALLAEDIVKQVRDFHAPPQSSGKSNLYVVADVSSKKSLNVITAVVAGRRSEFGYGTIRVSLKDQPVPQSQKENVCVVGYKVAQQLQVQLADPLLLRFSHGEEECLASPSSARGDEEDNQISITLDSAQRLAALPGKISLMQLNVSGTPREIREYIAALAQNVPGADVHGLRQFTDAEAKIYNRISGLLTTTIVLVLALTGLCVMAAMTNVAMERRNDVGLMKAIGGATRRVMRLFLAEAALLGLAGGVIGGAAGLLLSIWLGKSVFGVAARPRLIVYPVSVVLTIVVAIISSYPLRRLANISPASVFRGEA
jgi:putative ABC transport system permease protein